MMKRKKDIIALYILSKVESGVARIPIYQMIML